MQVAWNALGRLVGYLRFSEDFGLKMEKSERQRGSTFMDVQLKQQSCDGENNTLEIYSDSDWSGSGDMKSTSSAVHVMNGIVIQSTSRSQKCISLSSTEAEWYAASAGVCDAYYLQHIVEFVTGGRCSILTLHTDSSAVRMLSLKFGVGRLRHIRGRMLWLQQKMSNQELSIKQVPTAYNIADLNTKGLGRDRFLSLLYMLGFVNSKGEAVGEAEFLRLHAKERIKSCRSDWLMFERYYKHGFTWCFFIKHEQDSKAFFKVLSTCSLLELADGVEISVMSPEPEALGQWHFGGWWYYVLQAMIAILCMAAGFGFLAGRGFFRRHGQQVEGQPLEQQEVPFHDEADAGESAEDRLYRYKNDSISECSDPDYWMEVSHQDLSDTGSDSEEPDDPVVRRVIDAFNQGENGVSEMTLCSWLLARCSRRLAEAGDDATRHVYNDRVIALRTSFTDMSEGRIAIPRLTLRNIFKEFTKLSPRSHSPTSTLSSSGILAELLQMMRQQLLEMGVLKKQLWMELLMHNLWKSKMLWK